MAELLQIALNNVKFRAYHGLYPEERQKGNDFVVNLRISYQPTLDRITDLTQTIDYAALFAIIDQTMQHPVDLLETLVQTIVRRTHEQFPQITRAEVSVEKLNPPIDAFEGSATVTYLADFLQE